jgi:hypothetical protein
MTTSSGLNVYDAMRDTILIGVNLRNFRNGAFSNLITKDTPVVDAMNILIASSCLSSSEKEIVRSCRDEFIAFRNRFPGDQTPGIFDAIKLMGSTEKMTKMFDDDATARGLYVPPFMTQVINKDGSVKQSIVMNDDGTGTVTEGGIHGVPPGAPDGFAALQKENTKLFTGGAKRPAAKCKYLSSGAMREFSQLTYIAASPKEAENKESGKKDGKVDFGQAFSKNVRGAFM